MSDNYPEQIQHIQNGERVNSATIGRVTRALAARTDNFRLFQLELLTEREQLRYNDIPCSSLVTNLTYGYLNPANGLVETADLDIANPSFPQNMPIGVILNKRTGISGFICDILIKGRLVIPNASLSVIDLDPIWAQGAIFYLAPSGQMTSVSPALEIPVGISLAPTPTNDYNFSVDIAKNTELEHKHVRQVLTWDANGSYVLMFEPINPASVFLEINDQIQTFDDAGLGNWFAPPDPDYTVSGKALTVYTPARFEGNPEDPKVVVWYTTLVGSTEAVTGILAGKNIELSGCGINGGIGTGMVTITGKPEYNCITDTTTPTAVKKIEFNNTTQCIDVYKGPVVTAVTPGSRITVLNQADGSAIVSASASINTSDLLVPESIWLENAKNDLLFSRFDCAIIEPSSSQSLIAKFKFPTGFDPSYTTSLTLDYIVSTGIPTADLSLSLEYFQLELSSNLASAPGVTLTSTFELNSGNSAKLIRKEILLSNLTLVADSTLIVEISRDTSDAYTGNFNILNTRLRYRGLLV